MFLGVSQPDKTAKALTYLEAALAFVESAIAMETEPQTPKSAYTMFSETLDLIRCEVQFICTLLSEYYTFTLTHLSLDCNVHIYRNNIIQILGYRAIQ